MPPSPFLELATDKLSEISLLSITVATLASAVVYYIGTDLKERSRRKGHAKIPGPTRLPVLGSALSMPQSHGWLAIANWKQKYGMHSY